MGFKGETNLSGGHEPGLQPKRPFLFSESESMQLGSKEVIDPRKIEVRFGDPKTSAPRLLELFTQRSTIEHIGGMRPDTTKDEILDLFKGSDVLLIAETPDGKIVGTITVQPPGFGTNYGSLARMAVDESARHKGIAKKLVKAANAYVFSEDGLDCNHARAAVILGINGDHIAQHVFASEGYVRGAEIRESAKSWSNSKNRMIEDRNVQPMFYSRRDYKRNRPGEHKRHFPKQPPLDRPTELGVFE